MQLTLLIINFLFLLGWLLYFTFCLKDEMNSMVAMAVSMALGMVIGLYVGTISYILYPDFFFEVTIVSMLVGGIIGVIAGLPSSLAAVVDGLLSGAMGGMMGTMLGMMISPDHHIQLLNILSVWTVGIFFLVYLLLIKEIEKLKTTKNFWVHPLTYFLLICVFLFFINDYSIVGKNEIHHDEHHYYLIDIKQNDKIIDV